MFHFHLGPVYGCADEKIELLEQDLNPGLILCRFSLVDHKLLSSEPFMENQLCKTCSDMERKIIERKLLSPGFEPMNSRSQCIHSTAVLQPLPFIVKIIPKSPFCPDPVKKRFFPGAARDQLKVGASASL